MKHCFFLLLLTLPFGAFAQNQTSQTKNTAKIALDTAFHDFGDIAQGEVVEHTFHFQNNGQAPLQITHVATTCGCTAPEWPREPVEPGDAGRIVVRFDSNGKEGIQQKIVTIFSNAATPRMQLKIRANILP